MHMDGKNPIYTCKKDKAFFVDFCSFFSPIFFFFACTLPNGICCLKKKCSITSSLCVDDWDVEAEILRKGVFHQNSEYDINLFRNLAYTRFHQEFPNRINLLCIKRHRGSNFHWMIFTYISQGSSSYLKHFNNS